MLQLQAATHTYVWMCDFAKQQGNTPGGWIEGEASETQRKPEMEDWTVLDGHPEPEPEPALVPPPATQPTIQPAPVSHAPTN